MKHTKEPWTQGMAFEDDSFLLPPDAFHDFEHQQKKKVLANFKYGDYGDSSTLICTCENEDDAKRIAACVNACAEITTEALESGLIKHLLNDAFMRTLNPFNREEQSMSDMTYLGKPIFGEDFEEVE